MMKIQKNIQQNSLILVSFIEHQNTKSFYNEDTENMFLDDIRILKSKIFSSHVESVLREIFRTG